jgi:transcriptional regulator with XRE-family HTH domain
MAVNDEKAQHAGMALRDLRRRLGLSQEALERRSGVSQATLSRFEVGQDIYLSNAVQLADALGVTLDELAGRAPLPAGALRLPDQATPKDPYPNRSRLRALPEYKAAPAEVRELIEALPGGGNDLTLFEWIGELQLFSMLHKKGQLEGVLRGRPSTPKPESSRATGRRARRKPGHG